MSLTVSIRETGLAVAFPGTENDQKGNCDQGASVRLSTTFKSFAGERTDPAAVSVWITFDGSGDSLFFMYGTGEIVRDSTGVFHYDIDTTLQSGVCNWRVAGTSLAPGARQGSFYITPKNP